MKWLLAALFIGAGTLHLARPDVFLRAMPPYIPWHLELVLASGVIELLLGGLLLSPGCRIFAAWCLILLLVAVFPANVHMALHPELFPSIPPWLLWARLPMQGVLIAWAWWFTGEEPKGPYFWLREQGRAGCVVMACILLGIPAAGLILWPPAFWALLGQGAMIALLALYFAAAILYDPPYGIAPYFDRRVGDLHTYGHGATISRLCPELDRLAGENGVRTVSSFGFDDEWRGEAMTWHDPADGLRTFETIRRCLPEPGPLSAELDLVIDALRKAEAKGARFCLLITDGFTNGMEHEQRKGSFF